MTLFVGCLFLIGAVYYFIWFQSDISEVKNEIGSTLIQAEYLVMKKYDLNQGKETSKISANNGYFKSPNQLTLDGKVILVESKDEGSSKKSNTDKLFVEFEQKAFQSVIRNAKVKKANAIGNVSIQFSNHLIHTETCQYSARKNTLQTTSKVIADGKNRQIEGDSGFIYDLKKEKMKMHGKVKGFFGG